MRQKRDTISKVAADWYQLKFVSNSLGDVYAKNWQYQMTSDKDITKIKRTTFFSETQCIFN